MYNIHTHTCTYIHNINAHACTYILIWIDFKTYKCSNMYTPSTLASASGMWYDLTAPQFPINCGAITLIKLYRFYSHNLSSIWHYRVLGFRGIELPSALSAESLDFI